MQSKYFKKFVKDAEPTTEAMQARIYTLVYQQGLAQVDNPSEDDTRFLHSTGVQVVVKI